MTRAFKQLGIFSILVISVVLESNFLRFSVQAKQHSQLAQSKVSRKKSLKDEPETTIILLRKLVDQANQADRDGSFKQATFYWEKALSTLEQLQKFDSIDKNSDYQKEWLSGVQYKLGHSYANQGLHKEAIVFYLKSLKNKEQISGEENSDVASILYWLARSYAEENLNDKAEILYLRTIEIFEKVLGRNHPKTAVAYAGLAENYSSLGLFVKAESLYLRALGIQEKALGENDSSTGTIIGGIALLYKRQGLYDKAHQFYQRSLDISQINFGKKHPYTATALFNLASLYYEKGNFAEAQDLFIRSLIIREEKLGKDSLDVADSLLAIAQLDLNQELENQAHFKIIRALSIYKQKSGPDHPLIANALNLLAESYAKRGLLDLAESTLEEALEILTKNLGEAHPQTSDSLNNLAVIKYQLGSYKESEELYLRSLKSTQEVFGVNHPKYVLANANLAGLYKTLGLLDKSEFFFRRSLEINIPLIQREVIYLPVSDRYQFLQSKLSRYAFSPIFSMASSSQSRAKLALFARLNNQGLLAELQRRQFQLANLSESQKTISVELGDITQRLSSKNLQKDQFNALYLKRNSLESNLYRMLPELKPRTFTVEEISKVIPRDGVLIEFQRYTPLQGIRQFEKDRYLAMVLNPGGKVEIIDLGLAQPIEQKIQQALLATQEGDDLALSLWEKIGESIIKPLIKATQGSKAWFISPDAELNRIPFAALSSPDGNGLLGEQIQLRLLTTGRELVSLAKSSKQSDGQIMIVANPNFDKSQTQSNLETPFARKQKNPVDVDVKKWAPLPKTAIEGEELAKLTGGQLLVGEKATTLAIQNLDKPKVLHIASHAFFEAEQSKEKSIFDLYTYQQLYSQKDPLLRSYIVLAGANQPQINKKDDGILTALEITKLDWFGTEMVVVSGCESAKGEIQSGEGVYGLKRAISVAGARSSLLSLWEVDDEATAAFMKSFYQKLKNGEGRADALAATQKEFRNHPTNDMWRQPYVWAAFQLTGDWRSIDW